MKKEEEEEGAKLNLFAGRKWLADRIWVPLHQAVMYYLCTAVPVYVKLLAGKIIALESAIEPKPRSFEIQEESAAFKIFSL